MLPLHPHNQKTFERLCRLFEDHDRAAVVQPTGTGKSFVILRLIEDKADKRFAVCSPSAYIFSQIKAHAEKYGICLDNCEFVTYTKLSQTDTEELKDKDFNFVVLDEFHRCGAVEWSKGVQNLLDSFPNAKVLGTSATPIRYLDSCRDMARELFDGIYASNMSLAEAIRLGILPLPIYVTSFYSFRGETERLEERANRTGNPRLKRVLLGKLQEAKRLITQNDCGLESIFKRHIPNPNGKYIVFCPGVEKLRSSMKECGEWFGSVNGNLHKYAVYSSDNSSEKQFEDFKNDSDKTVLKLLFCVDMLNEGVHIEDVDGVVMLRATQSANVFYQQLGRALSCSDSKKRPVIFDIVNNFETGDTANQYASIMELDRRNGTGDHDEVEFELYDYVRDIREILNELHQSFENSWELVFETLKEYKEKFDRFPSSNESYDGMRLGTWCINQRKLYNAGKLSKTRVEKLNGIGFVWSVGEENWNAMFARLSELTKMLGHFPKAGDFTGDYEDISGWLNGQRTAFRCGRMSEDRVQKLKKLGCRLNPSASEKWEQRRNELAEYARENGRFPTFADSKNDPQAAELYIWINSQQKKLASGKMSDEQKQSLDEINFPWTRNADSWSRQFELLKEFVAENGSLPKRDDIYKGAKIGVWYASQLNALKSGKLSGDKKASLESLGTPLISGGRQKNLRRWNEVYDAVRQYILDNDDQPKVGETLAGIDAGKWIYKQNSDFRAGRLSEEQVGLLREIGVI